MICRECAPGRVAAGEVGGTRDLVGEVEAAGAWLSVVATAGAARRRRN